MTANHPTEESRAKEFLGRVGRIQRRIKWKKAQVEQLRELSTGCSAQISDMPRSDSPNLQRLETLVCKIADMDAEIQQDEAALAAEKIDLALMVCSVPSANQQAVLTERYMNGKTWTEITDALGLSRSRVFAIHEDALCSVESRLAYEAMGATGLEVDSNRTQTGLEQDSGRT